MRCHTCPSMNYDDETLAKLLAIDPNFRLRETCCVEDAKREEELRNRPPEDLLEALRAKEAASEVYRGPPRNRFERRRAAKLERRR